MDNCDLCNHVAHCLLVDFRGIAARISTIERRVNTQCQCYSTSAFPLSAYLSFFSNVPQADEIVVAEMQIHMQEQGATFECDILRNNQDIVAEIPARFFRGMCGGPEYHKWARECVQDGLFWILQQESLLTRIVSEYFNTAASTQ